MSVLATANESSGAGRERVRDHWPVEGATGLEEDLCLVIPVKPNLRRHMSVDAASYRSQTPQPHYADSQQDGFDQAHIATAEGLGSPDASQYCPAASAPSIWSRGHRRTMTPDFMDSMPGACLSPAAAPKCAATGSSPMPRDHVCWGVRRGGTPSSGAVGVQPVGWRDLAGPPRTEAPDSWRQKRALDPRGLEPLTGETKERSSPTRRRTSLDMRAPPHSRSCSQTAGMDPWGMEPAEPQLGSLGTKARNSLEISSAHFPCRKSSTSVVPRYPGGVSEGGGRRSFDDRGQQPSFLKSSRLLQSDPWQPAGLPELVPSPVSSRSPLSTKSASAGGWPTLGKAEDDAPVACHEAYAGQKEKETLAKASPRLFSNQDVASPLKLMEARRARPAGPPKDVWLLEVMPSSGKGVGKEQGVPSPAAANRSRACQVDGERDCMPGARAAADRKRTCQVDAIAQDSAVGRFLDLQRASGRMRSVSCTASAESSPLRQQSHSSSAKAMRHVRSSSTALCQKGDASAAWREELGRCMSPASLECLRSSSAGNLSPGHSPLRSALKVSHTKSTRMKRVMFNEEVDVCLVEL